jgi:hypothetical protein
MKFVHGSDLSISRIVPMPLSMHARKTLPESGIDAHAMPLPIALAASALKMQ